MLSGRSLCESGRRGAAQISEELGIARRRHRRTDEPGKSCRNEGTSSLWGCWPTIGLHVHITIGPSLAASSLPPSPGSFVSMTSYTYKRPLYTQYYQQHEQTHILCRPGGGEGGSPWPWRPARVNEVFVRSLLGWRDRSHAGLRPLPRLLTRPPPPPVTALPSLAG